MNLSLTSRKAPGRTRGLAYRLSALCLGGAVLALWPIAAPEAQNLLANGSFESPKVPDDNPLGWLEFGIGEDIAGWTVDEVGNPQPLLELGHDGVDLHARQNQIPWTCADGLQALDLNGQTSAAVFQDVSFTTEQWHSLSFFMSANLACSPTVVTLIVTFDNTIFAVESFDTTGLDFDDMGWELHQYLVDLPAGSHRLKFASFTPGPCGPAIDDVAFEPLWDLGDAPATYGTRLSDDGAAHRVSAAATLYLGSCVDVETDAAVFLDGFGDDDAAGLAVVGTCPEDDDEDGVFWETDLVACQDAMLTVTAAGDGLLDAWLDFDGDGTFSQAGEQVFAGHALTAGANPLTVAVPCDAVPGDTYSRFRISSLGGLAATGPAEDGEVEDHPVFVISSPPTEPVEIPTLGEWGLVLLALLMSLAGIEKMRRCRTSQVAEDHR